MTSELDTSPAASGSPSDTSVERYIVGDCTTSEASEVEAWLRSAGETGTVVRWLRGRLEEPVFNRSFKAEADLTAAKSLFARRIDATRQSIGSGVRMPLRGWVRYSGFTLRKWVGYAGISAAACCILGFTAWHYFYSNNPPFKADEYLTYSTRSGQRASVTLGDGSRITIGPATVLHVSKLSERGHAMTVDVSGEALFSVNHSGYRTFTVTAHGVATRVLGTEFIVRAYDTSMVRIAVREGRVSVQSSGPTSNNAAIITAGEAASVIPGTRPVVETISDVATDFGWVNGELVFRNIPLGEAVVRLSRWYGVEFRVADPSLLDAQVNGIFPSVFSRPTIQGLAGAINAHLTQSGLVFTFSRN